jgi:signal transduction histidine kinase
MAAAILLAEQFVTAGQIQPIADAIAAQGANSKLTANTANNTGSDPTAQRVCEMMERQVNHMVRLVDDLLEVSRITRGSIELRKEETDLASVIRSAVETSKPLIEAGKH